MKIVLKRIEDLRMVDLVAVGGFLISRNYSYTKAT